MQNASRLVFLAALTSPLASSLLACGGSSSSPPVVHDGGATDAPAKTDAGKDAARDVGHAQEAASGTDAGHDATRTTPDAGTDSGPGEAGPVDGSPALDVFIPPGTAITAPSEKWTWVPFPDAICANGTATGLGVNLSTKSSKVLIYMEGGGACWSDLTCNTLMTASFVTTGYGASEFASESTNTSYLAQAGGFFDRTAAANPFKDYSYVYVPYCTGDVFGGDNVVTLGSTVTHFVGYRNVGAYLARIVPTFPSASRVILAGSSAGGFGAALNWPRTQTAFGNIRVDLIDDSGTAMPNDVDSSGSAQIAMQSAAWNLNANLPAGCTTCASDLSSIYGYYDTLFPTHRGALLSYEQDSVLPGYFGISTAEFQTGLTEDVSRYFKPADPLKSFVINKSGHVLWFQPWPTTSTNVTVQQFITQMVTDDAGWKDEGP